MTQTMIGPGMFQWNRGGWVGGVVGGTSWMFALAADLVAHDHLLLASVSAASGLLAITIAYGLWMRRDRVEPYVALQAFLGLLAVLTPAIWLTVESFASEAVANAMGLGTMRWGVVCLIPLMMLLFAVQDRWARSVIAQPRSKPE